jgi:hypothetical protein
MASLRVAREARVLTAQSGELVVVSAVPGIVGEALIFDLCAPEGQVSLKVQVAASRPVVLDDVIKHEIRLSIIGTTDAPETARADDGAAA